jgi:hypothetical protein
MTLDYSFESKMSSMEDVDRVILQMLFLLLSYDATFISDPPLDFQFQVRLP